MSVHDDILETIRELPPLSRATQDLLLALGNPDHTAGQVAKAVGTDPLLAVRVLKVANSAAYARRVPTDTIDGAVAYLGDATVAGIALGADAGALYDAPLEGYEAERGALWKHCLDAAFAARRLAEYACSPVPGGVAYAAGLLHDIGKALLSIRLRERAGELADILLKPDCPDFLVTERRLMGIDHAEAGAMLARHWHLPETLCTAIRWHHEPSASPEEFRSLVYAVHLADIVAMMSGEGTGVDAMGYAIDPHYVEYVALDRSALEKLLLQTWTEFSRADAALGEAGAPDASAKGGAACGRS